MENKNNNLKQDIENLNDNQAVSLFNSFSDHLLYQSIADGEVLLNHPIMQEVPMLNLQELDGYVIPHEQIIVLARQSLSRWAGTDGVSQLLQHFKENYPLRTASASLAISLGFVILSTIVASSLKIKWKYNRPQEVCYDPSNISNDTIEILKSVTGIFPKLNKPADY